MVTCHHHFIFDKLGCVICLYEYWSGSLITMFEFFAWCFTTFTGVYWDSSRYKWLYPEVKRTSMRCMDSSELYPYHNKVLSCLHCVVMNLHAYRHFLKIQIHHEHLLSLISLVDVFLFSFKISINNSVWYINKLYLY